MAIEPLIIDDDYPELLADLARAVHEQLLSTPDLQITYQRAGEIAMATAERVRINFGGINNYVPKGVSYMASVRDKEMYAKFNGSNYAALAREYNRTEMRVRQICGDMLIADRKARQKGLFDET
jgi:Mor family transcriptional regulator